MTALSSAKCLTGRQVSEEDYMDTWASITREFIYLPSRQRYDRSISATNSDRLASMQASSLVTHPATKQLSCWTATQPLIRGCIVLC